MARQELPSTETRERLRTLVAPLREERATLVARQQELSAEVAALRNDLAQIDAVLSRLDPESVPKKKSSPGHQAWSEKIKSKNHQRALDAVRLYASEHPELASEGFTISTLEKRLRKEDVRISTGSLHPVLDELHESGEIRLDRIVVGGGKLYKFTGNGSVSDE